jgi:hypothetical protein
MLFFGHLSRPEVILMQNLSLVTHYNLLLKSLILVGLVLFGFFLAGDRGWLSIALNSDRSYISYVILLLYAVLSLHWLALVIQLATDTKVIDNLGSRISDLAVGDLQLTQGMSASRAKPLKKACLPIICRNCCINPNVMSVAN